MKTETETKPEAGSPAFPIVNASTPPPADGPGETAPAPEAPAPPAVKRGRPRKVDAAPPPPADPAPAPAPAAFARPAMDLGQPIESVRTLDDEAAALYLAALGPDAPAWSTLPAKDKADWCQRYRDLR